MNIFKGIKAPAPALLLVAPLLVALNLVEINLTKLKSI